MVLFDHLLLAFFFFSQKVDHKTLFFLTVSKRLRNLTMVNRVLKYTRQVKSNIILNLVKRSFPSEWYDWPKVLSYKVSFEIEIAKQFDKKILFFASPLEGWWNALTFNRKTLRAVFKCRKGSWVALALVYFTLWLVKKTHATISTNQRQD